MFQFHIGAIKRSGQSATNMFTNKFQFHIGAIKRKLRICRRDKFYLVSIPYWCD